MARSTSPQIPGKLHCFLSRAYSFGLTCSRLADKGYTSVSEMKTFIVPTFLPKDNTTIYQLHLHGCHWPFETPVVQTVNESSGVVYPFQERPGRHVIMMEPAADDGPDNGDWEPVNTLELQANRVYERIMTCPADSKDYLVALILLTWYLIDSHASITHLPNDHDFFTIDEAVWAVLAFFRNQDALHGRISETAKRRYLKCHSEFMTILFIHGVKADSSIYHFK